MTVKQDQFALIVFSICIYYCCQLSTASPYLMHVYALCWIFTANTIKHAFYTVLYQDDRNSCNKCTVCRYISVKYIFFYNDVFFLHK